MWGMDHGPKKIRKGGRGCTIMGKAVLRRRRKVGKVPRRYLLDNGQFRWIPGPGSEAPDKYNMDTWSVSKNAGAGKVLIYVAKMLRLSMDDLKVIEDGMFCTIETSGNTTMVYAFGLVVRWLSCVPTNAMRIACMANNAKSEDYTGVSAQEKVGCLWDKLWELDRPAVVWLFIVALYVAIKQIDCANGEPVPLDVRQTLRKFGQEVSVTDVNKVELRFLMQIGWRTHLKSNPHHASADAQTVVQVDCEYDHLVEALPQLFDMYERVQWVCLCALVHRLK